MKRGSRRCPRCSGDAMLHVRGMKDQRPVAGELFDWAARPVGEIDGRPIGHYDTLICRRCGYTTWYAYAWSPLPAGRRFAYCNECTIDRPHAYIVPIFYGPEPGRFVPAAITTGRYAQKLGRLEAALCEGCGRASFRAHGQAALRSRWFVPYRIVDEIDRPCLSCGATVGLVHDWALRDNGSIPVAVRNGRELGAFLLRVCRPCDSVEWYARGLQEIQPDPRIGVHAVGRVQPPYR